VDALVKAAGWTAAALLVLLGLPLQLLLWAVSRPFDPNYQVPGRFLRIIGVLFGHCYPRWRFRVEGAWPEGSGPYVVVSNHQSLLDIVLLSRMPREMKWVGKEELFRIPWIGLMLRLTGDIAVRRGDSESGGEAVARAKAYLARGMSVMIFPEGTRSRDARLLPFKSGAFRLAIEAGVPVLPVAVWGTAEGIMKGGLAVGPCDAVARLLPPHPTTGLVQADAAALRDRVRAAMAAALPPEASAPAAPRDAGPRGPPAAAAGTTTPGPPEAA
jgi:1-acyl-sn-glycerol-3-phosphate acyltransferase